MSETTLGLLREWMRWVTMQAPLSERLMDLRDRTGHVLAAVQCSTCHGEVNDAAHCENPACPGEE